MTIVIMIILVIKTNNNRNDNENCDKLAWVLGPVDPKILFKVRLFERMFTNRGLYIRLPLLSSAKGDCTSGES